jgi:hypothetical protein
LKFATAQEKADHRGEHGVSGLGFRCGACELAGHYPKSLTRAEKLKKHFKKVHGILEDLDLTDLQCIFEPCFVGKSCGGLFFLSSADLKEHIGQAHPSTITLPLEPDRVRVGEFSHERLLNYEAN